MTKTDPEARAGTRGFFIVFLALQLAMMMSTMDTTIVATVPGSSSRRHIVTTPDDSPRP